MMLLLEEDWIEGEVRDFRLLQPVATVRQSLEGWTHADALAVWDRFWEVVEKFRQTKGEDWLYWAARSLHSGLNRIPNPEEASGPVLPSPPGLTPPPFADPVAYKMPRAWRWLGADDWLYLGDLDALAQGDPKHPFLALDAEVGRAQVIAVLTLGEAAHGRTQEAFQLYARWGLVKAGQAEPQARAAREARRRGGENSSRTPNIVIEWLVERLRADPDLQNLAREAPGKAASAILKALPTDENPNYWAHGIDELTVCYVGPEDSPTDRKIRIHNIETDQAKEAGRSALRETLLPRALQIINIR